MWKVHQDYRCEESSLELSCKNDSTLCSFLWVWKKVIYYYEKSIVLVQSSKMRWMQVMLIRRLCSYSFASIIIMEFTLVGVCRFVWGVKSNVISSLRMSLRAGSTSYARTHCRDKLYESHFTYMIVCQALWGDNTRVFSYTSKRVNYLFKYFVWNTVQNIGIRLCDWNKGSTYRSPLVQALVMVSGGM